MSQIAPYKRPVRVTFEDEHGTHTVICTRSYVALNTGELTAQIEMQFPARLRQSPISVRFRAEQLRSISSAHGMTVAQASAINEPYLQRIGALTDDSRASASAPESPDSDWADLIGRTAHVSNPQTGSRIRVELIAVHGTVCEVRDVNSGAQMFLARSGLTWEFD